MKAGKIFLALVSIVALLAGLTPGTWAGGAGDPNTTCVVRNPAGNTLQGAVGLTLISLVNAAGPTYSVDVTLSLQRGGSSAFFRTNMNMTVLSPQGMVCQGLTVLGPDILSTFGFASSAQLVITNNSISDTDGSGTDCSVNGVPFTCSVSGTSKPTSLASIRIYVIQ